jgi:hypothetical protein
MSKKAIKRGLAEGWLVLDGEDEHGPWYRFVRTGARVRQRLDLPGIPATSAGGKT